MANTFNIVTHGILCSTNTYLIWRYGNSATRWLNLNRTLYILYGATGAVAYGRNERRSVLNYYYNKLHDICYVCGSALTNIHLANQIALQFEYFQDSKPSYLLWSNVLSFGLPVFCFSYYVILRSDDYELTQSLCKGSAFLTILLGGTVNSWSTIFSGFFYFMAYDCEVLKVQEDFYAYFRNAYNLLVASAQMLL
ncbi:uncharacterized protein LOC103515055 isoform X1 [Diaphorina citri]|uniref:Uncharacterized protein LOC103515055 isoform X1 n=1 Tax=Diaphorina citri TaxID=121845 RepID=A0A1S3DB81_DIACI|nr:uncharacterized protein LOC103515055 isoform X1 [Diaphorina citri]XP_017301969.1 uncharacterized protein LOC103515055 isoform X1 [Diaphorina citri]XP_026683670.1 uncharacterized protein LOC103515055 isoform X1 [Diaphorina citri]